MYLYIMSKRKKRRFYLFHFLEIIKTMCPPGYHHNGFVATDALGHMYLDNSVFGHFSCGVSCSQSIRMLLRTAIFAQYFIDTELLCF